MKDPASYLALHSSIIIAYISIAYSLFLSH